MRVTRCTASRITCCYGSAASRGSVVANDPINATDFTGLEEDKEFDLSKSFEKLKQKFEDARQTVDDSRDVTGDLPADAVKGVLEISEGAVDLAQGASQGAVDIALGGAEVATGVAEGAADLAGGLLERGRELGRRFTGGDDAEQQFQEIDEAQRRVRQGTSTSIIDSTEKSRQRANQQLRRTEIPPKR